MGSNFCHVMKQNETAALFPSKQRGKATRFLEEDGGVISD